ncbi:SulP family inorganic anion transporter [Minwuia thermotolerans]|uniref:Sulfate permease n=1 Tax=Minwuia thermotolerans TaxID=2056226 RepID=A0A2M9G2Y9_9PROT|nr:SulP family inorganic anion transporter [Minwuia thermotolerans]PJK30046.1 sulfate permease [Minwuia thermotolerans]
MRIPKLLTTLRTYSWRLFRADLFAGLTVAMVAIPLSIAIAIASGATPAAGLTTAIVAGFAISLLGGSRVQIGGPTGAFIVVVYGVIAEHGFDGLVLATAMAGLILVIAGVFRAGRLVAFIPEAVINGFTIGIAIIIATSQINDFLGLGIEDLPADFIEKAPVLWRHLGQTSIHAVVLAVATMAGIVLLRRLAPRFPGLIVAVGLGSCAVALAGLPVDTVVSRYGELPAGLPWPALPEISAARIVELFPSAVVIAFLAAIESLLSAMVADRMIDGQYRPNAEIIAQGVANLGSAAFAGLPATGAIARTATNVRAGGRTPVAGIVHAAAILAAVLLIADIAGYLAMPCLAALLVLTAWNMSEPHRWRGYAAAPVSDRVLLLLTMTLTVLVDLTVAIGVGVAVGLAIRLRRRDIPEAKWTPPRR